MLPPGHIAAGYLVAHTLLSVTHPPLSVTDQNYLTYWGMFFSFAPDLDTFVVFKKIGRFTSSDEVNHRKFYSHAPILWLVAGVGIFLMALAVHNVFLEYFGVLLWLGSWTHFVLDTIQHGVMWLWPWNNKIFALRSPEIKSNVTEKRFIPYWMKSLRFYATEMTLSLSIEIVIIGAALYIWL